MARGILYHITVDQAGIDSMTASDFFGFEDAMSVEYFEDRPQENCVSDIENLVKELRKAFTVTKYNGIYRLVTGDKAKTVAQQIAYFHPMLEELRSKVNKISTPNFIDPTNLYDLTKLIDDEYSDAVYLDMGTGPATYTLHGFLRRLQPGITYYISPSTVLMH